jgi:hypothetical protein
MVRGHAFYPYLRSNDCAWQSATTRRALRYTKTASSPCRHLAAKIFGAYRTEETARQVVEADAQNNREDPAVTRARAASSSPIARSRGTSTASMPAFQPTLSPPGSPWRSGKNRRPNPYWRRPCRHPEPLAFDEVVETPEGSERFARVAQMEKHIYSAASHVYGGRVYSPHP